MCRMLHLTLAAMMTLAPVAPQMAHAGGGRVFVQQSNGCYVNNAVVQQKAFVNAANVYNSYGVNVQAVAAIPLATVPVAVDLQAYQYRVNADAFSNYRQYMEQKYDAQRTGTTLTTQSQQSTNVQLNAETVNAIAKEVLKLMREQGIIQEDATAESGFSANQAAIADKIPGAKVLQENCISCHQAGNAPKAGFAMFDEQGNLYQELPFGNIASRVTTKDKELQMPPLSPLSLEDQVEVQKLAIPEGGHPYNPFVTAAAPADAKKE